MRVAQAGPPPPVGGSDGQHRRSLRKLKGLALGVFITAAALAVVVLTARQALYVAGTSALDRAEATYGSEVDAVLAEGGETPRAEDLAGFRGALDEVLERAVRQALATLPGVRYDAVDPSTFLTPALLKQYDEFVNGEGRPVLERLHRLADADGAAMEFNRRGSEELILCLVYEARHLACSESPEAAADSIADALRILTFPEGDADTGALAPRCRAVEMLLSNGLGPILRRLDLTDESLAAIEADLLGAEANLPLKACLAGHFSKELAWYDHLLYEPGKTFMPRDANTFLRSTLGAWLGKGYIKLGKAALITAAPLADPESQDARRSLLSGNALQASTTMSPWPDSRGGAYIMRLSLIHAALARAHLRSAAAAVAALRFRKAAGRWPQGFDEIVGRFIEAAPTDPFTGKPLLFGRDESGFFVYSTGINSLDDAGNPSLVPGVPGLFLTPGVFGLVTSGGGDAGFRIWAKETDRLTGADEKDSNKSGEAGYE